MSEPMIETRQLTKQYGTFKAVDKLDLCVNKGEIVGFLGQNGAGKTTTLLMLMGLSIPTSGSATVAGYDVVKDSRNVRRVTGLLPEGAGYYEDLTAKQNLDYVCRLNDIPSLEIAPCVTRVLESVGLSQWADTKVEKFSRGMKQRLGIAEVLVKQPKVAFFDEPTIGLDPKGTKEVRDMLLKLNKEYGLTILLSSHLLHDVQQTCQKVLIIRKGKLIAADTIENLSNKLRQGQNMIIEFELTQVSPDLIHELEAINGVTSVQEENHRLYVNMVENMAREVSETIAKHKATILLMKPKEHSLEEVFLKYYEEED
ncbi:MAG: ABC transporter ATP-binding protein [Candidatus Bathyarchaeota archaeon]|nr:ABC transporter ATP-binding protein [Candidatus Bathyarchaeota archaeon]